MIINTSAIRQLKSTLLITTLLEIILHCRHLNSDISFGNFAETKYGLLSSSTASQRPDSGAEIPGT